MENILSIFVFLVLIIVTTRILNEKKLKISNNIALLIVSFIISILFLLATKFNLINNKFFIYTSLNKLPLDELLLEGVLCFMLFAGASKLQFSKFINNFKSISVLSLLTTILNSAIYATLFYALTSILNIQITFTTCILLGCIISPTEERFISFISSSIKPL